MTNAVQVTDVRYTPATDADAITGLLGFLTFVLDGVVRLDGLALRRTRAGRFALSFPVRHDGRGRAHPLICPINDEVRRDIERHILSALGYNQEDDR